MEIEKNDLFIFKSLYNESVPKFLLECFPLRSIYSTVLISKIINASNFKISCWNYLYNRIMAFINNRKIKIPLKEDEWSTFGKEVSIEIKL